MDRPSAGLCLRSLTTRPLLTVKGQKTSCQPRKIFSKRPLTASL